MRIPLAVAAGGATGALARYLIVGQIGQLLGNGFPLGTLAANVIGSFLMGVLIEVTGLAWSPSPELRAMLVLGVLGAFSTFSTFSMEAVALLARGDSGPAGLYIMGSVALSVAGICAGMRLFRVVLS